MSPSHIEDTPEAYIAWLDEVWSRQLHQKRIRVSLLASCCGLIFHSCP